MVSLALATVLWFTRYVEVALERQDWVGWIAFALLCVVGVSAVVLILREIYGMFRLARLGALRKEVTHALDTADQASERRAVRQLKKMLGGRADLQWPLARFAEHEGDVLDPGDLLALADRELIMPLDQEARRTVLAAGQARRHRDGDQPDGMDRHALRADREPAHAARHRRACTADVRARSARCGSPGSSSATSSPPAASP